MDATSETSKASKEHNGDDGKTENTPTYTRITHDATANVTTTVNASQVILIHAEENSTVVLTGNQFNVTQQTQTLSQHHHTQQHRCESCARAHTSAPAAREAGGISTRTASGPAERGAVSSGPVTIQTSSHGVPSVIYAPGVTLQPMHPDVRLSRGYGTSVGTRHFVFYRGVFLSLDV